MRGFCWSLLFCLGMLACARWASAQNAAADADRVQFAPLDVGGVQITATGYAARVGSDGNLHSLVVNGVEFLDDAVAGSSGVSFFYEQPIPLVKVTLQQPEIVASNDLYTVRYRFEPGYLQITLRHANPHGAAYIAVCSAKVAFVKDLTTGTVATAPVAYQWGDVQMYAASGEYVRLQSGSRIWGREINRQVWECSNLSPNRDYSLVVTPGEGAPLDPPLDQLTTLKLALDRADPLVPAGEPVTLQARFENNSGQLVTAEAALALMSASGTPLEAPKPLPLVCESHQSVTLAWTITPPGPDFYRIACSVNVGGALKTSAITCGYDIAGIQPVAKRPDDFPRYWERIVAEARAADFKVVKTFTPGYSNSLVKVYEVVVEENGARLFSGWLSVPQFSGRYPGLIILPADRATQLAPAPKIAERARAVVFCIDPTNQDNIRAALKPMIDLAMQKQNLVNKETFGMRAMMIRCLQAVDVLASMKEIVDPRRLAVTGYGLGGGMALILGALDERIQAVAADVPFFCHVAVGSTDAAGRLRADWPYLDAADFIKANPAQRDTVMTTLSYFDAANFAPAVTCPVLVSAGLNDSYSRPENIIGVYNLLPGPRALACYQAGHEGGGAAHQLAKIDWLKKILGDPGVENPAPPVPEGAAAAREPAPAGGPAPADANPQ